MIDSWWIILSWSIFVYFEKLDAHLHVMHTKEINFAMAKD